MFTPAQKRKAMEKDTQSKKLPAKVYLTASYKKRNVFRKYVSAFKVLASESLYLSKTYAPIDIFYSLILKLNQRRVLPVRYQAQSAAFAKTKSELNLSNDWFSGNVPYWLSVIDEYGLR
jgi:hypothetical protein